MRKWKREPSKEIANQGRQETGMVRQLANRRQSDNEPEYVTRNNQDCTKAHEKITTVTKHLNAGRRIPTRTQ